MANCVEKLPISYLEECFNVDFESGTLWWKHRPATHFKNLKGYKIWMGFNLVGKEVKTTERKSQWGYLVLTLSKKTMYVHRLLFAMYHKRWPVGQIDHIDGNCKNNSINNLREVTNRENGKNQKKSKSNVSGFVGVHWCKHAKKWRVQIKTIEGITKHIAYTDDFEEAKRIRKQAEIENEYHPNHGRD